MAFNEDLRDSSEAAERYQVKLLKLLSTSLGIDTSVYEDGQSIANTASSIQGVLHEFINTLRNHNEDSAAEALAEVQEKLSQSASFGGLGISASQVPTNDQYEEIILLTEAWLESVKSQRVSRDYLSTHAGTVQGARPMTLAQKIFTQHALSGIPLGKHSLAVGDTIRAGIDWVLASELSWHGMHKTFVALGEPDIFRNDRFWLAGDHVVHPRVAHTAKVRAFVQQAERARRDFRMTDYQGSNYTILHTEFVRERAEPGMLVLGSDSHTCSAGAVGCLSIGLGNADVMLALALGETWFKVPESACIELVGTPAFGISGKDVILYILKELKRNTVAADRIVEFVGDGARHLSVDARFAICNMCTEFGAITGVFVPDAVTQQYIQQRKRKRYRSSSLYFRPDPDATYAERHVIDLAKVEPSIAIYPEPDNVVSLSEKVDLHLDGVFIGACTTTEEELVLAGLILKAGLDRRLPMAKGKRHYVPGSLPIVEKLKELGMLEVYEAAGFTRGPPGCSMCVGLSAEKAAEGETWLSSQNRNFRNRMGPGSFGHVTSAIVCAASAFSMTLTSPISLLQDIDQEYFQKYKHIGNLEDSVVTYVEPKPYAEIDEAGNLHNALAPPEMEAKEDQETEISSKVVTLGDFIDTDALSPGFTLTTCQTDEDFGKHVLCHTHPDFREKVSNGQRIVVAGHAFGVGSSRETAVAALKGAGVKAVIARSFAFIYGRNQPNLGLLGIVMNDDAFFEAARENSDICIELPGRCITVGGKSFPFELSEIEHQLTMNKGVTQSFKKYGKAIWERLSAEVEPRSTATSQESSRLSDSRLVW